jgi:hypothetical protein
MRVRRRVVVSCLAALLCAGVAARAEAAPKTNVSAEDAQRARALRQKGNTAIEALRYAEALAAYAITGDPALLYNQARAHQGLGDFPTALELLERFDAEATPALKARVPGLAEVVQDLRAHVTSVTVLCNIAGAEVRLNDRVVGTTPMARTIRVSSGKATVEVVAEGYSPTKREVVLPGGGALTVDVELLPKDLSGVLLVRSSVSGAHVLIDQKPVGQVPLELTVRSGPHSVRVERGGYEAWETSLVLRVGERRELSVPLVEEAAITKRWWFWTGIAVVVAGGITTVVLLTTERQADKGSLNPGQIAAPLLRF